MKTYFLTLSLSLAFLTSFAQDKIGTYEMSYFSKDPVQPVEASKEGSFYVHGASLDTYKGGIIIEGKKLTEFTAALTAARDKYVEWSQVAKQNAVSELDKQMEIVAPKVQGYWLSSDWHFDFSSSLTFRFKVMADGKHVLIVTTEKLQASDNQFMHHDGFAFVFTSVAEVNDLLALLDPAKVTAYFEEKEKAKAIFK